MRVCRTDRARPQRRPRFVPDGPALRAHYAAPRVRMSCRRLKESARQDSEKVSWPSRGPIDLNKAVIACQRISNELQIQKIESLTCDDGAASPVIQRDEERCIRT